MPDDFEDEQPCRRSSDKELMGLRDDLNAKHVQNRRDIHAVRNEQQKLLLEFTTMQGKIKPLVDNGQPGLISKMSDKIDEVADTLVEVRIAQGAAQSTATSRYGDWDWWKDAFKALIIGVMLALAAHFWK